METEQRERINNTLNKFGVVLEKHNKMFANNDNNDNNSIHNDELNTKINKIAQDILNILDNAHFTDCIKLGILEVDKALIHERNRIESSLRVKKIKDIIGFKL